MPAQLEQTELDLVCLYVRACRSVLAGRISPRLVSDCLRSVMSLDEDLLLAMGRLVDDPHPWVPLLQLLLRLPRNADVMMLVDQADAHLRAIGRKLLDAQGLSIVRVEDLLGRELPIAQALATLLSEL